MLSSRLLLPIAALLGAAPALAQDHAHPRTGAERLGQVHFPTSCRPQAQAGFERGLAMLHSFWFAEAERAFQEVLAADPGCGMAHWGLALAKRGNPFAGAPAPANLAAGLAEAERAAALTEQATPRERGFAAAALAFYRGYESRAHGARMADYEQAMLRVRDGSPDDPEAAIFYAQSVIANAPPSDMTFARQQAAAAILEPLFQRQPDHPGLAHYLIHAYDAPPLAQRGLAAATRYSDIAPSAPHALHMPSHVFTRLGMWSESIDANRRAAAADVGPQQVHPMDYLVYAYLQQGRDAEAERVVREASAVGGGATYAPVVRYNALAMPVRLALERSRWTDAAALAPPASDVPPEFAAIPRFGRGIGAARAGDTAAARAEVSALTALEAALRARGDGYWPVLVRAQQRAVEAWIAYAGGQADAARRLAREAAEAEESVEKHPVTPGPLLPARELEGDLLLALGLPAEARQAYERNLVREPNRARSLYGASIAAERAGDAAGAHAHHAALARLMASADGDRAEVRAARAP